MVETTIRIKGFRSRLNEVRLYHLQLFKDNSDERKTLTKVSTRKPLTNIPQTKAHTSERENQEIVCKTRKLVKGPDTAKTSKKLFAEPIFNSEKIH